METLEQKTATPEVLNSDGVINKLRDWVLNFMKIEKMTNDAIPDMPGPYSLHSVCIRAISVPTLLRSYG